MGARNYRGRSIAAASGSGVKQQRGETAAGENAVAAALKQPEQQRSVQHQCKGGSQLHARLALAPGRYHRRSPPRSPPPPSWRPPPSSSSVIVPLRSAHTPGNVTKATVNPVGSSGNSTSSTPDAPPKIPRLLYRRRVSASGDRPRQRPRARGSGGYAGLSVTLPSLPAASAVGTTLALYALAGCAAYHLFSKRTLSEPSESHYLDKRTRTP